MTFATDIATDFADVVDNLAPVSLFRFNGDSASVSNALRRAISTREAAASAGRYTASDVRFHFPTSDVSEAPRVGEVIQESAGTRWTILDVGTETLTARYRCACRFLAIYDDLDCLVSIEAATWEKDTRGVLVPTWNTRLTGVAAKIQEIDAVPALEDGVRQLLETHHVYLASNVDLTAGDRIRHGVRTFRVVRISDKGSLTTLQMVVVRADRAEV